MAAIRCPYCKGRVKSLVHGLRQEYAGRQRVCMVCGTIWRLDKGTHRALIGAFIVMNFTAAVLPYFVLRPRLADEWCIGWLLFCVAILWPLVYFIVWKLKVRR